MATSLNTSHTTYPAYQTPPPPYPPQKEPLNHGIPMPAPIYNHQPAQGYTVYQPVQSQNDNFIIGFCSRSANWIKNNKRQLLITLLVVSLISATFGLGLALGGLYSGSLLAVKFVGYSWWSAKAVAVISSAGKCFLVGMATIFASALAATYAATSLGHMQK